MNYLCVYNNIYLNLLFEIILQKTWKFAGPIITSFCLSCFLDYMLWLSIQVQAVCHQWKKSFMFLRDMILSSF